MSKHYLHNYSLIPVDHEEETSAIRLILHEGKFHQVKRMVKAVGKEVTYLKRLRMGGFLSARVIRQRRISGMTETEFKLQEQNK